MTANTVPQEYLTLARSMGMPKDIATNFYTRKINNKPDVKDLVHKLTLDVYGTEAQAKQALNRLWVEFNKLGMDAPGIPVEVSARVPVREQLKPATYMAEARTALERTIGDLNANVQFSGKKTVGDRIAVGGDIHGIFADPEAFQRFCADPADTAIVCGDFIDFLATTRHRQTIDAVTTRAELADARAKAELLHRSFRKIYYVRGNHDKRPLKRLQDIAPQLLPLLVDPLDLITNDLPNFKRLSWTVPGTAPNIEYGMEYEADYFGMLGDILVGHFETFMGADAVKATHKWLTEWDYILKLPTPPRVILQAHTHSLGMSFTGRGQALINTGCLCRPMPYQFDNAGKYNPPVKGYVALYQKDGVTDLGKTEFICLQ